MSNTLSSTLAFPRAEQAQIIRANQRDLYHVSSLKDQAENVLRAWLGTRWLSRWDKELDLLVKCCYYGLTTGRATQTLGEEYTDIWQYASFDGTFPPSPLTRTALILSSFLPAYALGKWGQSSSLQNNHPKIARWFATMPVVLDVATEINLALFYTRGTYYDLIKRLTGVKHISSVPKDPHTRPPSYSLLGILIVIRLLYRLLKFLQISKSDSLSEAIRDKRIEIAGSRGVFIDDRPVSSLLDRVPESEPAKPAEEDERTALDVSAIPPALRASRNCTLCLEERTDSCATECGHLFCWNCIVGWGREKPECPLCRQSLSLDKLLPIYNL